MNGWLKTRPIYVHKKLLRSKDIQIERGWEKYIPCNESKRKLEQQPLISDKIDPEIKILQEISKEGHYIIIKGSPERHTTVNIYAPSIGILPQYISQISLKIVCDS